MVVSDTKEVSNYQIYQVVDYRRWEGLEKVKKELVKENESYTSLGEETF